MDQSFGHLESTVVRSDAYHSDDDEDVDYDDYDIGSASDNERGYEDDRRGRATITALLGELEMIQSTYGRVAEALGSSEKENTSLLSTLEQLRRERQELLDKIARRSKSQARSEERRPSPDMPNDSFTSALQAEIDILRGRVSSLEEENISLRRRLHSQDGGEQYLRSPQVSPQIAREPSVSHSTQAHEAVGTAAGAVEVKSVATRSVSTSPTHLRHASVQACSEQPLGTDASSAAAYTAAQCEMTFQAQEEKLWLMVHARTKELDHVSKLLASAETRNVELSALLGRFCEQHVEVAVAGAAATPASAASQSTASQPSRTKTSSHMMAVQSQKMIRGAIPQLRSGNVPPPPPRLGGQEPPDDGNALSGGVGDRRQAPTKTVSVPQFTLPRRGSVFGKIVVEKPRWS